MGKGTLDRKAARVAGEKQAKRIADVTATSR